MSEQLTTRGVEVRREVLGDTYFDAAMASTDAFNRPYQDLVNEYCWGWLWTRDTLSRDIRSLLCIAMLSVLNRPGELKAHVNGALRNGCTEDQIQEVLLHATVYGGVPCGSASFRVVREALAEIASERQK